MLFINPRINPKSQNVLVNNFIVAAFPTGIGFLAGYLRERNSATIRIADESIQFLSDERLADEIKKLETPKIVGISVLTINCKRAFELAKKIKEIGQGVTVILGGIHPTVMPEECLSRDGVDIVVRGEGEATLSELYDLLKAKKSYEKVEGISYKKDGKITHNPNRKLLSLKDIPSLPYDLFEKDMDKYRDFGIIMTSRGCPFSCIFCSQRAISGNVYRYMSNERILNDIKTLVDRYKQTKIWISEDNIGVDKQRLMGLCDEIVKSGYQKKAEFMAELRGDSVDYDILKKMKEANFTMISFGTETTSDRLLKVLNKGEKVEANIRAIKMTKEVGIKVSTTFIFGIPTETREERLKSFRDAMALPLDGVRFNTAIPYPGTKLYEIAKNEGNLKILDDWGNFNVQYYIMSDDIPYVPKGMDRRLLIYDTMMANLSFYFRPRGIINMLKSPKTCGDAVTLPKNWYLSPTVIMNMAGLVFYIARRFAFVATRAFLVEIYNSACTCKVGA